jgi:tRNA pseudouridine(38-40) synthase
MSAWRRYCVDVQYVGNKFSGWIGGPVGANSKQQHVPLGVIEVLKKGLGKFVGKENFRYLKGSSRTDAGVHALCNRFHVDIRRKSRPGKPMTGSAAAAALADAAADADPDADADADGPPRLPFEPHVITNALNYYVHAGDSLRVLDARPVADDFNAVSSAKARTYIYRIAFNPTRTTPAGIKFEKQCQQVQQPLQQPWVLDQTMIWIVDAVLDASKMREAAQHFVQERDFTTVRNARCQALTPIRNITSLHIEDFSDDTNNYNVSNAKQNERIHSAMMLGPLRMMTITVTANAFLYRMVRNIVSMLVKVGKGELSPDDVEDLLARKDRDGAPGPAPAGGLFLVRVHYEEEEKWHREREARDADIKKAKGSPTWQ